MDEILLWAGLLLLALIVFGALGIMLLSMIGMFPSVWGDGAGEEQKLRNQEERRYNPSVWPVALISLFVGGMMLLYFWPI